MVRLPIWSLGNVDYTFITFTLTRDVLVSSKVSSMGHTELLNHLQRIIMIM